MMVDARERQVKSDQKNEILLCSSRRADSRGAEARSSRQQQQQQQHRNSVSRLAGNTSKRDHTGSDTVEGTSQRVPK